MDWKCHFCSKAVSIDLKPADPTQESQWVHVINEPQPRQLVCLPCYETRQNDFDVGTREQLEFLKQQTFSAAADSTEEDGEDREDDNTFSQSQLM